MSVPYKCVINNHRKLSKRKFATVFQLNIFVLFVFIPLLLVDKIWHVFKNTKVTLFWDGNFLSDRFNREHVRFVLRIFDANSFAHDSIE